MKQLAGFGAAIAFSALLATSSVAFASNPSEILTKATATAEEAEFADFVVAEDWTESGPKAGAKLRKR